MKIQLKKLNVFFLLLVFCFIPFKANAGIPTIDVANIVQTTVIAIENIQQVIQLYDQINNQIQQIDNQITSYKNLNGDYFKDALLNGVTYKKARRWVPKEYVELLDLYEGIATAGFNKTITAGWDARDSLEVIDPVNIYADLTTTQAVRWQEHEKNSMAAVGLADISFSRVDELINESEALMVDIKSSTDGKAAQDLANRLAVQNQLLLAEMIRITSTNVATSGRNALYQHALMGEDRIRSNATVIK